jgi:multidrug efflux pump subunit AcrA (membrane-fusion protein)
MPAPTITVLPTSPSRSRPSTFSSEADAFLGALPTFRTELNSLGTYLDGVASTVDSDKTAAESAQTAAETAQGLAESAQTAAESAQTAAETAQGLAESAQTAAEAAETNAEAALTSFEQNYLGAKSSPPSLDNDGNALQTGAIYYDTTDDSLRVYDGGWQSAVFQIDSAGALVAANNLSDLTSTASARSNLGLVIGTDVQGYDADLAAIASLAKTSGNFIVANGSAWVTQTPAQVAATLDLEIGTDVQAHDAGLDDISGLTPTNGVFLVGNGSNWVAESGATARASLGLVIGTDVQAYDADTLKSDVTASLTVGYTEGVYDEGTKSTGTFTPDPALRNRQKIVNGGAFTLAKPTSDCNMVILITNNASAGSITFSGFVSGFPAGDDLTTTNTDQFKLYIDVTDSIGTCRIEALQ